jgi:6,7-dimethyl-8-ribityllumazine synthase
MSEKLPFSPHVLIVEGRFYDDIADNLKHGAIKTVTEAGGTYELYQVPGALEIPAALKFAIKSMKLYNGDDRYHGFIVLGCVIRGETSHYEYVCHNSINLVQQLAVEYSLAIGNGILTVENKKQAEDRANNKGRNKGGFAAQTCLDMIKMKKRFELLRG